jgi:hypothetical protein
MPTGACRRVAIKQSFSARKELNELSEKLASAEFLTEAPMASHLQAS